MTIEALAKDVHQNAVAHGWWDSNRKEPEINALVHSEWSEALEEARAGRPLVWYKPDAENACWAGHCTPNITFNHVCHGRFSAMEHPVYDACPMHMKPEGIAVELIDGVIRIFDWIGENAVKYEDKDGSPSTVESLYRDSNVGKVIDGVPEMIAWLHWLTSKALILDIDGTLLLEAAAYAMCWVKKQGIDPLKLLLEKHEYNKGRPYKHGKKF